MLRVLGARALLPALYMVSIPSGMMTMSEVPTSTPVPSRVMMRSWREDREKERGRMPARKELRASIGVLRAVRLLVRGRDDLRNSHYRAQGEQHEKAVPHVASCAATLLQRRNAPGMQNREKAARRHSKLSMPRVVARNRRVDG